MENYHQESFGGKKQKQSLSQLVDLPAMENLLPIGAMTTGQNTLIQKPTDMEFISQGNQGQNTQIQNPTESSSVASAVCDRPAIFFSQLGQEVMCDEEESILEVAEQQGVSIRSGCRQGVCGACKVRKLDGEIRYEGEPDGLSSRDFHDGCILPCIAFPVGKVAIDA